MNLGDGTIQSQNPKQVNDSSDLAIRLQALSSRVNAINELAATINQSLDMETILTIVQDQVKWLLDFRYCSIGLLQEDGSHTMHILHDQDAQSTTPELEALLFQRTITNKCPQRMDSSELLATRSQQHQAQQHQSVPAAPLYHSWLAMPIESHNQIWGAILFAHEQPNLYSTEELRIAHLLAIQLANAVCNAKRFTEVNELYARLEGAYSELQRAEQLREDMIKMVIHDLRNPLNVIHISLDLIHELIKDAEITQALTSIKRAQRAGKLMYTMISDLLDFNKLESDQFQLDHAPADLNQLLLQVMDAWKIRAERDKKHLCLDLPSALPPIYCNARLIRRVFDNLLGNAFKYTAPGDTISISATFGDQELQVTVQDSGIGIPLEYQQRIFDKFVQVPGETGTHHGQGSGLGLAFCKLIIEAHGGQISVESTVDVGSQFTFTLPHVSL